jgi:hypothetical protein
LESKKTKKINNKDDYEKSGFKGIIEDVENTKDEALQSVVPKVKKEQMPSDDEMTKEILDGEYSNNNNNNLKRPQLNTKKEKTISSKISKFAKGFRIPNDKNKKNSNKS